MRSRSRNGGKVIQDDVWATQVERKGILP